MSKMVSFSYVPFLFKNSVNFRFNVDRPQMNALPVLLTVCGSVDMDEQHVGRYEFHHICMFTWTLLFSDSSR